MLVDSAGQVATTDKEADLMIMEYFANIEDAELMDENALRTKYNERMHHDIDGTELDTACLPHAGLVAGMFARVKRRKAPGKDDIHGDLLRICPRSAARHYGPIMFKTS
eukprot:2151264-Pyramimonas_sp.AAC.1